MRNIGQNGRRQDRSGPLALEQDRRSSFHRLVDPGFHAIRRIGIDHRSDHGRRIHRVAAFQSGCGRHELVHHALVDGPVDQDPLHLDAHLPGIGESAEGEAIGNPIEVTGIFVHRHRGVPAQLEDDFFLPCDLFEVPAYRRASREGEQLEARIGCQPFGDRDRQVQHVIGAGRQPAVGQDLSQPEGQLGTLRRGLHHQSAAHGDRRSHFVGQEIEREVEG